jgi:hypothetical protein
MTRINRTIVMLAFPSFLIAALAEAAQPSGVVRKPVTISGRTGVAGVTMRGLPGDPAVPITDENGVYSVRVPYDFSGTVIPTKLGYSFDPPAKEYRSVREDLAQQDYVARILTFTISGQTGVAGVTMRGLPGNPVTDREGRYKATVEYGWMGVVTPVREGHVFEPPQRAYASVTEGLTHEDYTAKVFTYRISGTVGLPDVVMKGLPGDPVSDAGGYYLAMVPHGWSGTVTPEKAGFGFEPASRRYVKPVADLRDQDYHAAEIFLTISNRIALGDEPLAGVTVTAEPGGYSAVTNAQGIYSIQVPYGWSGKLVLTKKGFTFDPSAIPFSNVTADVDMVSRRPEAPTGQTPGTYGQQAQPKYPRVVIPTPRNVLIIPTAAVAPERIAETREDMQVMLQILREKLSEPRMILGTLYDYGDFFGRGGRGVEAVYLQGYGALFMLEVEFPISFPPEPRAEDERDQEQVVDPVWQRARERLYVPPAPLRYGSGGRPNETSEMSFEQFREELLKTLRHAANLRHIEPNEVVILTVIGQGGAGSPSAPYGGGMMGGMGGYGGGMMSGYGMAGGYSRSGGSFSGGTGGYGGGGGFYAGSGGYSSTSGGAGTSRAPRVTVAPASATVLTLQAKKADIDAFAKGEIDLEQFRQKVKTFTY